MKRAPLAPASLVLLAVGCAHAPPPLPRADTVTVGGEKAQYHDLSKVKEVCDLTGQQVAGELKSVNTMVTAFLQKTEPADNGEYTGEQLDVLQQGVDQLGHVLDIQEKNVETTSRCRDLEPAKVVDDAQKQARSLVKKARERLDGAPQVITAQRQKLAIEAWKKQQVGAVQNAHDSWCPPKLNPTKMPDIFYAVQDEQGRTSWLFCDGSKVVGAGEALELIPPANTPKHKLHHTEKQYIAETQKYPATEIQKPPTGGGATSGGGSQGGAQGGIQ
jgi:hypothetical protein